MYDIQTALEKIRSVGTPSFGSMKSLHAKQELLLLLLANEQSRLVVWLFPMDLERKQHFLTYHHKTPSDVSTSCIKLVFLCQQSKNILSGALKTAWVENPALAVHFAQRFNSTTLTSELRWLLMTFPDRVLDQPDALEILLGPSLPNDVSFQLKVRKLKCAASGVLTPLVFAVLGCGQPHDGCHLLLAGIWQPSLHYPIRNARPRESFCRRDFLLCASNCADTEI